MRLERLAATLLLALRIVLRLFGFLMMSRTFMLFSILLLLRRKLFALLIDRCIALEHDVNVELFQIFMQLSPLFAEHEVVGNV